MELAQHVIEAAADGDIGDAGSEQAWEDVGLAFEDAWAAAAGTDDCGFRESAGSGLQLDAVEPAAQQEDVGQAAFESDAGEPGLLLGAELGGSGGVGEPEGGFEQQPVQRLGDGLVEVALGGLGCGEAETGHKLRA